MNKYFYSVYYDFGQVRLEDCLGFEEKPSGPEEKTILEKWKIENIGSPAPGGGSIYKISNLDELAYYEEITLLNLIQFLESFPDGTKFKKALACPHSARNDYSCLAFELVEEEIAKEKQLTIAKSPIGEVYCGWKGGDFKMNINSIVYLAEKGDCGVKLCKAFLESFFVPIQE